MKVERIIEEAYKLYMPQDRYEITELAQFVADQMRHRVENVSMGRGEIELPIPFNILEIGTKFGGTFYIWNKLVQEHGDGLCISVDMSDGGIHGGISDEKMDKRDLWFNERFTNCHFIRGNSHYFDTLDKVADTLGFTWSENGESVTSNQIDFLFIDGDHSYDGVKMDFEMYSILVKTGGIIAFHDINDTQRHRNRNVYVGKFWNEIKDDPRFEAIEFNSNLDWAGIGVLIQK